MLLDLRDAHDDVGDALLWLGVETDKADGEERLAESGRPGFGNALLIVGSE